MDFNYIDIHSHLNLPPLIDKRGDVIANMHELGVATFTIGTGYENSKDATVLAKKEKNIWAGVGQHPNDDPHEIFDYDKFLELAKQERVVCIGECGLDYFRQEKDLDKDRQRRLFEEHIKLAVEVDKPLMIHARASKGTMDAYVDALEVLNAYDGVKGNFHFFAGDLEITKKILDIGFTMSFDGPITFARDYDEVIRYIPLEMLHAETDSPYAAPVPYRGKMCEPWMVAEVVKQIAIIKELREPEVREALLENAKRVFGI